MCAYIYIGPQTQTLHGFVNDSRKQLHDWAPMYGLLILSLCRHTISFIKSKSFGCELELVNHTNPLSSSTFPLMSKLFGVHIMSI